MEPYTYLFGNFTAYLGIVKLGSDPQEREFTRWLRENTEQAMMGQVFSEVELYSSHHLVDRGPIYCLFPQCLLQSRQMHT